jgi:poly(glycerol-phosphate) alpha-glucosyltransferase
MRIAFLTPPLDGAGGVATVAVGLAAALAREEVQVEIFDDSDVRTLVNRVVAFRPDLLHTHGMWLQHSRAAGSLSQRYGIPEIISPHGMLDAWAMRARWWKKQLAWYAYERSHFMRARVLHALCEPELDAIRKYVPTAAAAVIANGVDLPTTTDADLIAPWEARFGANARVLLYLGRMHEKKGLQPLLRAWALNKTVLEASGWRLALLGWDDGGFGQVCANLITELGLQNSCHWFGPVRGKERIAAYRKASCLVLPSYSEGLPMVVLEAWSYRLPVLMTAECNLPVGFERRAALQISTVVPRLGERLVEVLTAPAADAELNAIGAAGFSLVREEFTWQRIAAQFVKLYGSNLGKKVAQGESIHENIPIKKEQ